MRRVITVAATALLLIGLFSACQPRTPLITIPGLYPPFERGVVDYVNHCSGAATEVRVSAPSGARISIDGQRTRSGNFIGQVSQAIGDRFIIRVTTRTGTSTHYVRCLPPDFPTWTAERTGDPQSQYYSTVVIENLFAANYGVVFDTNGVPIWWTRQKIKSFLLTLLPNKHFAIAFLDGPAQELALDGSLVRSINTVGGANDFHEVILLPNRNYVLATAQPQTADLTSWGESADSTVLNHVVQVLTPAGRLVWAWDVSQHIPVTETTPTWRGEREFLTGLKDPWHINSVEWTGDGFIMSFRNLDAVYKVDFPSGKISWKLGGSTTTESLSVMSDPVFEAGGSLSGQHDARLLPDGTVTLFDNGSQVGRVPRSVRYRIDLASRTATFIDQITGSPNSNSFCCGSTRLLRGGNWVTGWGGTPDITENRPDGTRVFRLEAAFIYRGLPITFGQLSRDALRAGMDAQYAD